MLNTAFSPWPSFTPEECEAVARVLGSNRVNYWTGEEGRLFERAFAEWTGTAHAIALMNGTVALELALRAFGIGPGDEVIVSPRSFMASASCVVNVGATPIFADVSRDSGNITAETIGRVVTPRTRAVIPVHLAGWPCDMDPIMALAEAHGLKVIEDCAQAHGARYKGRSVGSIGHAAAWSFCQDKIMTTGGEGGMVTTNDADAWSFMWSYKDHGKSWDGVFKTAHPPGFRWVHDSIGTNWRMTEMQAAIGRIQLGRMADWTRLRTAHADRLLARLRPFATEAGPLRIPCAEPEDGLTHAYYKLYVYVRPENLAPGWSRDRIIAEINAQGVPCYQGSCPEIYLEKAFADTPSRPAQRLSIAQELGHTSMMFLVHPTLQDLEIEKTITVAADVFRSCGMHA